MKQRLVLGERTVLLDELRVDAPAGSVSLTKREVQLLAYLCANERVVSRRELLTEVWGYHPDSTSRAVHYAVLRLRRKLEDDPSEPIYLQTVYGGGYRLQRSGPVSNQPTDNIVPYRTALVGQAAVLRELAAQVTGRRLVTLTGPGGVGKTRLATELGVQQRGQWPGGVWLCSLAQARTRGDVLAAVAQVLGVTVQSAAGESLLAALQARERCLLILDNFEQVRHVAPQTVSAWLDRAPRLHVLVTSRAVLGLAGEHLLPVLPLVTADAVALFSARARQSAPGLVFSEHDREEIAALVGELDGLPLAIELAAARARVLSPGQMRARVGQRFQLLRSRTPRPPRHQALWAALEWSWAMLSGVQRSALSQCALFAGGVSMAAAAAVLGTGDTPVEDVLADLVDQSLLVPRRQPGAEVRFGMLESVREFVLAKAPPETAAAQRHERFFAALGTDAAVQACRLRGGQRQRRTRRAELDNLRVAAHRAAERGALQEATLCAIAVAEVFLHQGPFDEGVAWLQKLRRTLPTTGADGLRLAVQSARLLRRSGRPKDALVVARGAIPLAQQLQQQEVAVLLEVGGSWWASGDTGQAERACRSALRTAQERGTRAELGWCKMQLAGLLHRQGNTLEALHTCREALAIARAEGDREREAGCQGRLGIYNESLGRLDEACENHRQALAIAREQGDRIQETHALGYLGNLHGKRGASAQAEEAYAAALAIARQLGERRSAMMWLGSLGNALAQQDRLEEAAAAYAQALEQARALGDQTNACIWLGSLGRVAELRGDLPVAQQYLTEVLELSTVLALPRIQASSHRFLGLLYLRQHQLDRARDAFTSAEALLRPMGAGFLLARQACAWARLEAAEGDLAAARRHLADAEARIDSSFAADSPLLEDIRAARAAISSGCGGS